MILIFALIYFVATIQLSICDDTDLEVKTIYGTFVGQDQRHYIAYEGIRYAEPPIGMLRFEPPVPIGKQPEETFDLNNGTIPACINWNPFTQKIEGSEDCLRLNVYTPKSKKTLLPVVFHIHGGAWTFGSAAQYAEKIIMMHQDFVFVNFNYRLGVLGFLSSGDETLSGNMGLKDQAMALHWIRENIEAFGGDPEKIIITGFSAGAASAHLFYLSPLTRNYFSAGVSHSGSAMHHWVLAKNNSEKYSAMLNMVECDKNDANKNLQCLKAQSAETLIKSSWQLKKFEGFPAVYFALTVEPESEHAFLSETPETLLKRGECVKKPWLVSAVKDEGIWFTGSWSEDEMLFTYMNDYWNDVAPYLFMYEWIDSEDERNSISQKIKEQYIKSDKLDISKLKELTNALSDRYFKQSIGVALQYQAAFAPTFMYHFTYKGDYGFGEWLSNGKNLGICHGEDIQYIYSTGVRADKPFSEFEENMSDLFLDMYKSLAETGIPKLPGHEFPPTAFDPHGNLHFLQIDSPEDIQAMSVPHVAHAETAFWDATVPSEI